MINIIVAGAGAGKTTNMASRIIATYDSMEKSRNIYCISFTNNAAGNIKNKITELLGYVPEQIKISTIHSFLYQEIIKPYYFLMFDKQYERISNMQLSDDIKYANSKICELDRQNLLHIKVLPQRAKWIFVKKSDDNTQRKHIRKIIQQTFSKYCGAIFIDEAQDIDNDFYDIVNELIKLDISIQLVGDPKQDLKGYGNLRKLISIYENNVTYIKDCYRCPQKHIKLSNSIVDDNEKQNSKKEKGSINLLFESDICLNDFIKKAFFDLKYISEKNERFKTNKDNSNESIFNALCYEVENILLEKHPNATKEKIACVAYYFANKLYRANNSQMNPTNVIKDVLPMRLTTRQYARIINLLKSSVTTKENAIFINSIESIKGREGFDCLFVLTCDLAEYLFKKKLENNKTKNKLYVALTRSLENLTILISIEVENRYSREFINEYFHNYLS